MIAYVIPNVTMARNAICFIVLPPSFFALAPLPPPVVKCGRRKGVEFMSDSLRQSIDHYFSVFRNNVEEDLHNMAKPTPAAIVFQAKFEEELNDFRTALFTLLHEDGLI